MTIKQASFVISNTDYKNAQMTIKMNTLLLADLMLENLAS